MQKHFLKLSKVFTNIALPPLILISNNFELSAKYLTNEVEKSIKTLEIKINLPIYYLFHSIKKLNFQKICIWEIL